MESGNDERCCKVGAWTYLDLGEINEKFNHVKHN